MLKSAYTLLHINAQKNTKKGIAKGGKFWVVRKEITADFNIINNTVVLINIEIHQESV